MRENQVNFYLVIFDISNASNVRSAAGQHRTRNSWNFVKFTCSSHGKLNPAYSIVPALLRRIRRFHTFYFVLSLEFKCVALDVYTSYNVVKLTCYNNIHNIHKFLEFYVILYFSISGVIGEVTIFDHHVGTLTIKIWHCIQRH